jgi:hypothetical protein
MDIFFQIKAGIVLLLFLLRKNNNEYLLAIFGLCNGKTVSVKIGKRL